MKIAALIFHVFDLWKVLTKVQFIWFFRIFTFSASRQMYLYFSKMLRVCLVFRIFTFMWVLYYAQRRFSGEFCEASRRGRKTEENWERKSNKLPDNNCGVVIMRAFRSFFFCWRRRRMEALWKTGVWKEIMAKEFFQDNFQF